MAYLSGMRHSPKRRKAVRQNNTACKTNHCPQPCSRATAVSRPKHANIPSIQACALARKIYLLARRQGEALVHSPRSERAIEARSMPTTQNICQVEFTTLH